MKTHYDVLGVSPNADKAVIKMAFRKAAKIYHPDLNAGDPLAAEHFKQITAAHTVLTNPEQRAALDRHLRLRRRYVWREWSITLASWIVAGFLSAGLTSGCVLVVRSMTSIKEAPAQSLGASLAAGPAVGASPGRNDPRDRQAVAVVRGMLLHGQPLAVQPLSEDRPHPFMIDPIDHQASLELVREPTRTQGPDRGGDTNAETPALLQTNEPISTAHGLSPTTMDEAIVAKVVGQKRFRSTESTTRGAAKGRAVHTASLGDYIFYEHASGSCETDDELRFGGPSFSECGSRRGHHLLNHHAVKERRAAVRRARFPTPG